MLVKCMNIVSCNVCDWNKARPEFKFDLMGCVTPVGLGWKHGAHMFVLYVNCCNLHIACFFLCLSVTGSNVYNESRGIHP